MFGFRAEEAVAASRAEEVEAAVQEVGNQLPGAFACFAWGEIETGSLLLGVG